MGARGWEAMAGAAGVLGAVDGGPGRCGVGTAGQQGGGGEGQEAGFQAIMLVALVSLWGRLVRPASTMLMAGLQDERMKIEIEVTARIGSAAEGS